jgi:hypothetical protein
MEKSIVRTTEGTVQVPDVHNLRALASDLLNSGLFQGVKNVAGAVTVIQAGIELGIPPVAALNTMAVINGRLSMEAKALLAIAQKRAGVTWRVVKEDDKGCEIIFSRPGWPDTSSSFTEEEAQTAGLLGKSNWKLYRKDMLFARAAGRGIRRIAPDAVLGLYAKEEMVDVTIQSNGPLNIPSAEIKVEQIIEELGVVHGAKAGTSTINDLPGGKDDPKISEENKRIAELRDELAGVIGECEGMGLKMTKAAWDQVHALTEETEYKKAIETFKGKLGKKSAKKENELF